MTERRHDATGSTDDENAEGSTEDADVEGSTGDENSEVTGDGSAYGSVDGRPDEVPGENPPGEAGRRVDDPGGGPPPSRGGPNRESGGAFGGGDVRTRLLWVALFVLGLLAVFALVQFYTHAGRAIDLWVADRFRPIVQAAFNLAVLLVAGGGIAVIVSRIAGNESGSAGSD